MTEDTHHTLPGAQAPARRLPAAVSSTGNLLFPVADGGAPVSTSGSLPVVMLDSYSRIRSANRAFCGLFGMARTITNGVHISSLGRGDWDQAAIDNLLRTTQETKGAYETFVRLSLPGRGRCLTRMQARYQDAFPGSGMILLTVEIIGDAEEPETVEGEETGTSEAEKMEAIEERELAEVLLRCSREFQGALELIAGRVEALTFNADSAVREEAAGIGWAVGTIHSLFQSLLIKARATAGAAAPETTATEEPRQRVTYSRSPAVEALARTLRQRATGNPPAGGDVERFKSEVLAKAA